MNVPLPQDGSSTRWLSGELTTVSVISFANQRGV